MSACSNAVSRWPDCVTQRILFVAISVVLGQVFGSLSFAAAPHPVSISSALVDLQPTQLRIEMQIMLEDLVLYHQLAADGEMQYKPEDLKSGAEKHRKFVTDYFSVLDVDGNRIPGKIEAEVFDQIGEQAVPQAELMKRSISFLLVYELPQPKPQYLTFLQNFGGPNSALPAMMDLYITRNEAFEESAQIAYNRPHTVKIDWSRNPDGKKLSLAELRQLRKDQLRDRLGIGSFTGLYSFLYINRFEVRHEILVPLMTLDQFVPMQRADEAFLEVEEQEALRPAIEKFFLEHGQVTINEQTAKPTIQRVSFFGLNISDFALNADPRRIGVHQGRVGVILSYPSTHVPKEVTMQWDTFSEYAPFIDTTLMIGDQPPDRTYFYPNATEYKWQGELIGPVVKPIAAQGNLGNADGRALVLQQLLENVYRAFDFRADEEVYDSLAASVKGELLRELYLRVKRSLIVAEQGGELSHVTNVDIVSSSPNSNRPNVYETVWTVTGVSEHWGHIHTRTTEYRAELSVLAHEGNWKIDGFQLLEEKRIRFDTRIRGHDSSK